MNRLHRSTQHFLGRIRPRLRRGAFLGTLLSAALLSTTLLGGSLGASAATAANTTKATRFTIYVAGDSTASIYSADYAPRTGWGQALPVFTGSGVIVRDAALSGASSKSFADLGLLDQILSTISPGDYLLISFGHNDEKTDEARHTDPYTTYQSYLRRYLDGARQHGAHPVLVTPVERRRFDTAGHALLSHGEYPAAMRQLAAAEGVPLIDLTASSRARWEALGPEGTKAEFLWLDPGANANYPDGVQDNTHFQAHGAIEVARLIGQALRRQRVMPADSLVRLYGTTIPDSAIIWPATVAVG